MDNKLCDNINYILFSKNEGYQEGAEKIRTEALRQNKNCEIIEIHNLSNKKVLEKMKQKKSLVYLLTNDDYIPIYVELLKNINIKIINESLLSKNLLKFVLQERIKRNGVCIPNSIWVSDKSELNNLNKIEYPIFIKSQKQASKIILVKNEMEFYKKIKSINNINEYYIEKAIDAKEYILKKYYCVKGSIIDMDFLTDKKIPAWLKAILKNISKSLEAEVFSVDIFINLSNKNYFCIDINPASSFFRSDLAREKFVKNILI